MSTFEPLGGLRPYELRQGITARAVHGDRITMAVVDLEPAVQLPEHHHENEQLGFVMTGEITMTIGGDRRTLQAGDTYRIPSDVPHHAVAGDKGCTVVDVFSPVRADWEKLGRRDPAPGRWP